MTNGDLGLFDGNDDIGDVGAPGSTRYDGSAYRIVGSGHNMWFDTDAFHFAWTRVEGDIRLEADVSFPQAGTDPHRKACLVFRQSLDADSAYADIAVHGDGLTSLQFRSATGQLTYEVEAAVSAPQRVGIERRGNYVTATVDGAPVAGAVWLELTEPFYVGLAVCSHLRGVSEEAVFENVVLEDVAPGTRLVSVLETIDIASMNRRTVHVFDRHIEAPNWLTDGRLLYNSEGRLYTIPVTGGESTLIDTGFANACNNDHGLSPDETLIAISDQSQDDGRSVIYTVPVSGGTPKRVTANAPSYWHGWSPDGSTLAYCAERDGKFGIFTIPAEGGEETRLTTAEKLDDGPDYSPDGEWIYFNSDRTGLMQIYRIRMDGTDLERITDDGWGDWFAHPSPDGNLLAMVSYGPEVEGHPADKDVQLRLVDLATREITTLARLFGGQGTINVPSWSPDGASFAFVSYQYV